MTSISKLLSTFFCIFSGVLIGNMWIHDKWPFWGIVAAVAAMIIGFILSIGAINNDN